jgi:cysteinyl-tRNA synthetase
MEEARESLKRIDEWSQRLSKTAADASANEAATTIPDRFEEALDDDLNISAALGFLFESIRETNRAMDRGEATGATAAAWLAWWRRIDQVLQLSEDESALPPEIAKLAEERERARLAKDWKKSDELRDQLNALGWDVRDTKDGRKVTRRAGP